MAEQRSSDELHGCMSVVLLVHDTCTHPAAGCCCKGVLGNQHHEWAWAERCDCRNRPQLHGDRSRQFWQPEAHWHGFSSELFYYKRQSPRLRGECGPAVGQQVLLECVMLLALAPLTVAAACIRPVTQCISPRWPPGVPSV
jgi:hypothetical protein